MSNVNPIGRLDQLRRIADMTIARIQVLHLQTNLMKKIILLTLVGTGLLVAMPFTAQALDSGKIAQYDRYQNRNDYDRDRQNRNDYDRDSDGRRYQSGDRLFVVYYRNYDDRKWIYVSKHYSRRAAERAADRLERRGYRTQIL
jgi:hypothetical protein